MRTGLFDNQKNALIFGGCILLGAIVLVGEEDDEGVAISTSAGSYEAPRYENDISDYRPPVRKKQPAVPQQSSRELDSFYSDDDDGLDDAEGSDPAPTMDVKSSDGPSERRSGPPKDTPPGIDGPGT